MKKTIKKYMAIFTILSVFITSMTNNALADERGQVWETGQTIEKSVSVDSMTLQKEKIVIEMVKKQKLNDPALSLALNSLEKADRKIVSVKNGIITAKKAGSVSVQTAQAEYLINVTEPHFMQKKYTASVGEVFLPEFESCGHTAEYSVPSKYAENVRFVAGRGYEVLRRGNAKITVTINGVEYTARLKIDDPRLSEDIVSIGVGSSKKLKLLDCSQKAVWSTSDSAIVSVKNGRLKGISRGSAVVSALCGSKVYKASVYVSSCQLTTKCLVLNVGETKRVGIAGVEEPDYKDEWQISGVDKGIITLLPNGTVSAVKKGSAKICTVVGGKKYQIKVKVNDRNAEGHVHSYKQIYQDPADLCTMHVETVFSCECGSEYVERGEAGHIYELVDSKDSTCSEPAADTYICSRCGVTYVKARDISECPLKEHSLTHSGGKEDLWRCSQCKKEFVRNSDGSFTEFFANGSDENPGSSSSTKEDTSSSSVKKDDTTSSSSKKEDTTSSSVKKDDTTSSSAKKDDTTSSSKKNDTTSSSKKNNTTSSSSKQEPTAHNHSSVSRKYIDDRGEYYFDGYECITCGKRWLPSDSENYFSVLTYNTAYPMDADMLNETQQQLIADGEITALSAKKAGLQEVPGYTFTGWSLDRDGAGVLYSVGERVEVAENAILYAVWQRTKYQVNYKNTLGAVNDNPSYFTTEKASLKLLPVKMAGYEFLGWSDEEGKIIDEISTDCLKARIITAKWKLLEYDIKYQSDNENCLVGDINPDRYDVTTEAFYLNNPEPLPGYEFLGWTGDEVTEPVKNAFVDTSKTGDREYTAHFRAISYRVRYMFGEGVNDEANPASYTVEDTVVLKPAFRQYYSFEGWYTSADYRESSRVDSLEAGTIGDVVLYARWIKNVFDFSAQDVTTVYDGKEYSIDFECQTDALIEFSATGNGEDWNIQKPYFKNAGEYRIYYRVSKENYETIKGSRVLIIDKAEGYMREPYAKYLVYNGQPQVLISLGYTNTGCMMYSEGASSTGVYAKVLPTAVAAGTYHVWYYSEGDENHHDTDRKGVTVSILKAASAVTKKPTGRSLVYNGKEQALVMTGEAEGGKMVYALATSIGAPSAFTETIPTAVKAGKYYVYYKCGGDANHEQTQAEYIEVTIEKAQSYVYVSPGAKSLTYSGNSQGLVNDGTAVGGEMYYGVATQVGGAVSYSKSIPTAIDAGKYYVYYKAVGDENHTDSAASYVLVTIGKAAGYMSALPTAKSLTYNGSYQTLINPGSTSTGKMYYKLSDSGTYSVNVPSAMAAGEYTVYYYSEGDANHGNSSVGSVAVKIAPKEMTVAVTDGKIKYTGSATSGGARINVSDPSGGYTVKYGTSLGNYYFTTLPTYTEIGTYTVYYQVSAANYATKTGTLSISITKADGSYTRPSAVYGLTYTGKEQTLIKEGSSTTGTMYYRLGKTGEYKAELPRATEAGTYTVYYYSKGDAYHLDTTPSYIEVTMKPAELEIEFKDTEVAYDGYAHYPTVKVSSKAVLREDECVAIFFNSDNSDMWCYAATGSAYVNETESKKLPFEWVPKKIPEACFTDFYYYWAGTYKFYYKVVVFDENKADGISTNFNIKYANCDLVIVNPNLSEPDED